MKRFFVIVFFVSVFVSCNTEKDCKPMVSDRYSLFLIDSILQYGLDHEALYTLLGNVKPMSSLVCFSFPIANADTASSADGNILNRSEHGTYLDRIHAIQKAINGVQIPDIKIVMIPYKTPSANRSRLIQISAIRISAMDSVLKAREDFFGQFGLVPGADPAAVVNTIEYSDRYERLRGYGYLFGYPDYAVDFFVRAFQASDRTGKFAERNFFQIPVYSDSAGYFVYAFPKNAAPSAAVDSVIFYKATHILERYRSIRSKYLNPDSSLRAYKLLMDFNKNYQ